VSKFNPSGSSLLYSTYLSGNNFDRGNAIAVDSGGDAYVTGYTGSSNFPTTSGAFQVNSGGGINAFVSKLNPSGGALLYSTYLGGSGNNNGNGIAVDSAGDAYVTGSISSGNFPTTRSAIQTSSGGGIDAFVSKLNPSGSRTPLQHLPRRYRLRPRHRGGRQRQLREAASRLGRA